MSSTLLSISVRYLNTFDCVKYHFKCILKYQHYIIRNTIFFFLMFVDSYEMNYLGKYVLNNYLIKVFK